MLGPELRLPFYNSGLQTFVANEAPFEKVQEAYPRMFDAVTTSANKPEARIRGAKTAVATHEEAVAVCDCLNHYFSDFKVILVVRRDLVASCGSLAKATRSGVWHSWAGRSPNGKIKIPRDQFLNYANTARSVIHRFRTLSERHDVLELSYEDDVCGGDAHTKLFDFLGLDHLDPTWVNIQKLNADAHSYIENYTKLETELAAMPAVTAETEEDQAAAIRRRHARELPAAFLLGRAAEHAKNQRWALACSDLEQALEHEDATRRTHQVAKTYAALETADHDASPQVVDLLRQIDEECGNNPVFRQIRAIQREMASRLEDAREDLVEALLCSGDALGSNGTLVCVRALIRVLKKLNQPGVTAAAVEALAERYGEHPQFGELRAILTTS